MPKVRVRYVSATSIGLFEQASPHYGEIWYDLGGRQAMSRSTTAESVLETIYSLAGIAAPADDGAAAFRGHPLAVPPRGAATIFHGVWPAAIAAAAILSNGGRDEPKTRRSPSRYCWWRRLARPT